MKSTNKEKPRDAKEERRAKKKKEPEFGFHDRGLPAIVWRHFVERLISHLGLSLIYVISSLTKHNTKEEAGRGCWGSNAYLARCVGIHPKNVSQEIQKLIQAGLLVEVYVNGERYLETVWARPS